MVKCKKIRITALFILSLSFFYIIGCSNTKNFSTKISQLNLNELVSDKINNNGYGLEIYRIEDNTISGSIINENSNPIIYSTDEVFTYNLIDKNIMFYNINPKGRIIDFKIHNELIYYIDVYQDTDEIFNWELIKYTTSNEKEVLKTGRITDIINTPRILGTYNKNLILFLMSNDGEKIDYELIKYDGNKEIKIINGSGIINSNIGTLPYNVYNYYIYNEQIYYSILDEIGTQKIYSYNLKNDTETLIFENTEGFINNYKINEKYQYYQIINSYQDNSKIIIKNSKGINTLDETINTFDNFINEHQLLFHNQGDIWKILDLNNSKIVTLNIDIKSKPKYYKIENNRILIESKSHDYFIVDIT